MNNGKMKGLSGVGRRERFGRHPAGGEPCGAAAADVGRPTPAGAAQRAISHQVSAGEVAQQGQARALFQPVWQGGRAD